MNRRGFTLIELLVALVLGGVVMGAAYQTLVMSQRASHAMVQRIDVQQTVRAGVHYLSGLLRELDATDGDILVATPTTMTVRARRWAGVSCTDPVAVGALVQFGVRSGSQFYFGDRAPDANLDSILVFRDGDPASRGDDRWLVGAVRAVAAGVCTDATPAHILSVEITAASGGADSVLVGVTSGAPLRGIQVDELALYQEADGRWWMGRRTASRTGAWSDREPLIGPLENGGLRFSYLDSDGDPTTVIDEIAIVDVEIHGESQYITHTTTGVNDHILDSLQTRVALRNNARF